MKNYTAFALSIGSINPHIGKTKYDWNVYTNGTAVYECGGRLLIALPGTFKEGDVVIVRENDSQRKLQTVTIQKECKTKEELIAFLKSQGYTMTKPKPFQKFVGKKYKPSESYSVKGFFDNEELENLEIETEQVIATGR